MTIPTKIKLNILNISKSNNKDLFIISGFSFFFGLLWFSFQNIGIDCDFGGYYHIANFIRNGLYGIPEYSLWIRPPGYGFLLWITGTDINRMGFIVAVQSVLCISVPILIFLILKDFHKKSAFYITLLYILSFQPYFWSKALLTESWHIFLCTLIVYISTRIYNFGSDRKLTIFFVVVNFIAVLIRPTFIVISLISIFYIWTKHRPCSKYLFLGLLTLLSIFVITWSFTLSLTLPQQRIPSSKSESINLSPIQELFLYDFYLNNQIPTEDRNKEFESLKKLAQNLTKAHTKTTINIRPTIEPFSSDLNSSIDSIFHNPTHLKYFYLKTILKDGSEFNDKEIVREVTNSIILNQYLKNPLNLFKFFLKYSTAYLVTNNANTYLSFMKSVIETPFATYARTNGENSLYLHTILSDFFSNPKNNEQIVGIVGTKLQSFTNNWLDKDTRIFRDNLDWMQLFLILNQYLGPVDSSKLMAKVNDELMWSISKDSPLNIYNVPEWIPKENQLLTFLNLGLYHTKIYFFSPYLNNFGFHWNFVLCTDGSFRHVNSGLRLFKNFKEIIPNVAFTSQSYRDKFDQYLHYIWIAGRYIFLFSILIPFIFYKSFNLKSVSIATYILTIILIHSFIENFTSGSHVRYVDHSYPLYWLFTGILLSILINNKSKIIS